MSVFEALLLVPLHSTSNKFDDSSHSVQLSIFEGKCTILFGRRASCDVHLDDPNVSGNHCTVRFSRSPEGIFQVTIEDQSSNGSFVNNTKAVRGVPMELPVNAILSFTRPHNGIDNSSPVPAYRLIDDSSRAWRNSNPNVNFVKIRKETALVPMGATVAPNLQSNAVGSRIHAMLKHETELRLQLAADLEQAVLTIESYRQANEKHQDDIVSLKKDLSISEENILAHTSTITSLTAHIATLKDDIAFTNETLQSTKSHLETSLSEHKTIQNSLKSQLDASLSRIATLTEELAREQASLQNIKGSLAREQARVAHLDEELESERRQRQESDLKLRETISQLNDSKHKSREAVGSYSAQMEAKNALIMSLEASKLSLERDLLECKASLKEQSDRSLQMPRQIVSALTSALHTAVISPLTQIGGNLRSQNDVNRLVEVLLANGGTPGGDTDTSANSRKKTPSFVRKSVSNRLIEAGGDFSGTTANASNSVDARGRLRGTSSMNDCDSPFAGALPSGIRHSRSDPANHAANNSEVANGPFNAAAEPNRKSVRKLASTSHQITSEESSNFVGTPIVFRGEESTNNGATPLVGGESTQQVVHADAIDAETIRPQEMSPCRSESLLAQTQLTVAPPANCGKGTIRSDNDDGGEVANHSVRTRLTSFGSDDEEEDLKTRKTSKRPHLMSHIEEGEEEDHDLEGRLAEAGPLPMDFEIDEMDPDASDHPSDSVHSNGEGQSQNGDGEQREAGGGMSPFSSSSSSYEENSTPFLQIATVGSVDAETQPQINQVDCPQQIRSFSSSSFSREAKGRFQTENKNALSSSSDTARTSSSRKENQELKSKEAGGNDINNHHLVQQRRSANLAAQELDRDGSMTQGKTVNSMHQQQHNNSNQKQTTSLEEIEFEIEGAGALDDEFLHDSIHQYNNNNNNPHPMSSPPSSLQQNQRIKHQSMIVQNTFSAPEHNTGYDNSNNENSSNNFMNGISLKKFPSNPLPQHNPSNNYKKEDSKKKKKDRHNSVVEYNKSKE